MQRITLAALAIAGLSVLSGFGCSHNDAPPPVVNAPPVQHAQQSMPPQLQQVLNNSDRARLGPGASQGPQPAQ